MTSSELRPIDILNLKERPRRCLSRFEYGFHSFACFNMLLKAFDRQWLAAPIRANGRIPVMS